MTIFRAPPAEAVRIVALDDLTLIYHRAAGATHLLAEPAPEILEALADGSADAETLLRRLSERFDLDPHAEQGIAARLEELIAAGLVTLA